MRPDDSKNPYRKHLEELDSLSRELAEAIEDPALCGNLTDCSQRLAGKIRAIKQLEERRAPEGQNSEVLFEELRQKLADVQQAFRDSEEKFQKIFNFGPIIMSLATMADGRYVDVSDHFLRISEYTREEVIGRTPLELGLLDNPEDNERVARALWDKGRIVDEEITFKSKSGRVMTMSLTAEVVLFGNTQHMVSVVIDITERKKAEEALRESEELYTRLVDTIPDIIVRTDLDGKVLFVNDYTLQMSGYRQEEIIGQNMLNFVSFEDRDRMIKNTLVMMEKRLGPREYTLVIKDGTKIPFEVNGDVLRNEEGTPFGLVFVCRNINERKLAERIMRESENRLHGITMNMPGVVFQFYAKNGGEYGLSYIGERVMELFGLPQNILFEDFLPHVHEEDMEKFMTSIQEAVEGCRTWNFEGRFTKPSGELIWFHGLSTPTRMEDRIVFDGLFLNITERKQAEEMSVQAEEKFTKVFMTTPDCIAIARMKDGMILEVNEGFEEVLGWKRSEVIGRTSVDIHFWADNAQRMYMLGDLTTGRNITHREFQFKHRDGSMRTGIFSARPITIAGESCLIFVLQDFTEQRRLEDDRKKLEQQLSQSQKMDAVGQLAGGVAHDFNNMLSVIIGNTEMALARVDPSDPNHKSLTDILNAGKRSADLTRQLLAFARKQTVSPRVLDLNDTVSGMLKMLQRLIGEDMNIAWMPGQRLWTVKIDPSQVDQILANLMVNARDAIETAGRVVIETFNRVCDESYCSGRPECVPGEYVVLKVSDNGCGMEKETMDNIFEPFFTTKKEGRGTGLGLATVYGIVKQNSGFISVSSEPGLGSTFTIHLPRHKSDEAAAVEDKVETKIPRGTETILIVEDEKGVLDLSKAMLENLGYHVLAFGNTGQAIQFIREYGRPIDLLLTDVVMPGMTGKDLHERMCSIQPGMRCLYMSGYTADVIARQGILDEGIHFLPKPFSLKELASMVRNTLDQVS